MQCLQHKLLIKLIENCSDLLKLVYLKPKTLRKNAFKKREFEKMTHCKNGEFCLEKIHKSLKKSL